MKVSLLFPLLLCLPSASAAQTREIPLMVGGQRVAWNLFRAVQVQQPTVVVLITFEPGRLSKETIERAQVVADSLTAALSPAANRLGFVVEVRSTAYMGIEDPRHGASYQATPTHKQGMLLIRPGLRPSRFFPLLSPEQLPDAIREYSQLIRSVVPT